MLNAHRINVKLSSMSMKNIWFQWIPLTTIWYYFFSHLCHFRILIQPKKQKYKKRRKKNHIQMWSLCLYMHINYYYYSCICLYFVYMLSNKINHMTCRATFNTKIHLHRIDLLDRFVRKPGKSNSHQIGVFRRPFKVHICVWSPLSCRRTDIWRRLCDGDIRIR